MGFFAQHGMGVTGDAPGEVVRDTYQFIERRDVQAVAAADHRRERFGGAAQQIDVRVVNGLVPGRGTGMNAHLLRFGIATERLDDLGP